MRRTSTRRCARRRRSRCIWPPRAAAAIFLPGDRRPAEIDPGLAGWPEVHARLALVQPSRNAPVLTAAGARSGPVVYVAARGLGAVPRGLERVPPGSVLVVPESGATPPGPQQFAVAGCRGYDLVAARAHRTRRSAAA